MRELKSSHQLPIGGAVLAQSAEPPHTGGWRVGEKPRVQLDTCVNCLLCWIYCPDSAIKIKDEAFLGFDYDYCKGCGICQEVCPTGAIKMVAEALALPPLGRIEGESDAG
jgi:2-oxoacid:acceptor oxidoreductase delta subunit (pyruvate/2-ketoisovalerate family)